MLPAPSPKIFVNSQWSDPLITLGEAQQKHKVDQQLSNHNSYPIMVSAFRNK